MTPCYCRGVATCEECEGHICSGQCTCEHDGTPETRAEVTAGYVNPSAARTAAWDEKVSLNR